MVTSAVQQVSAKRYRIFILDDHPIVRQGLMQLINQESDLVVCGEATEVPEALKAILTLQPDLVLGDLSLRGGSGLDLIKTLHGQKPELPILVVSMHDEALFAERVLRAGARGYIMKQETTDTLLEAIRKVLRGEIALSEQMATRFLQSFVKGRSVAEESPLARLSDRELEVLQFLGRGFSTRQIAATLRLSVKTVDTHRAHIMRKLHLTHAAELVRYAVHWLSNMNSS